MFLQRLSIAFAGPLQDRAQLLKRLQLEMPELPPADLDVHDQWFKARRLHMTKMKDIDQVSCVCLFIAG